MESSGHILFLYQCPCPERKGASAGNRCNEKEPPSYPQFSRPGEVLSVFVETDRHHSVGGIESLLHTIPVMAVDVDI